MKALSRVALFLAACVAAVAVSACVPAESLDIDYDPECVVAPDNTVTIHYTLYNSGVVDLSNCVVDFKVFNLYDGLSDASNNVAPGSTMPVNIAVGGERDRHLHLLPSNAHQRLLEHLLRGGDGHGMGQGFRRHLQQHQLIQRRIGAKGMGRSTWAARFACLLDCP